MFVRGTCEAGGRIKPGAQAPGKRKRIWDRARKAGSHRIFRADPGACAPGFMLTPASQANKKLYDERIKKSEDAR